MEFARKYSLTIFFILSYLIMIIGVLGIYVIRDLGGFPNIEYAFLIISVTSPTIAATLLAGLKGGVEEIKRLYSSLLKWKVNPLWYLAGFSLMIVPVIIAIIYIILGGETTGIAPGFTISIFLLASLENLIMGPLSEELGWRGYALPELEAQYSSLTSSVILGVLWASWHIPLYLTEERMPFFIYLPIVLALAILFTWAFNNTGGSTLITIIFHFSFNFTGRFTTNPDALGLMPAMLFNITGGIFLVMWVILIIVYYKPRTFSRKPDSEMPYDVPTAEKKLSWSFWFLIIAFIIVSFLLSFILPSLAMK